MAGVKIDEINANILRRLLKDARILCYSCYKQERYTFFQNKGRGACVAEGVIAEGSKQKVIRKND